MGQIPPMLLTPDLAEGVKASINRVIMNLGVLSSMFIARYVEQTSEGSGTMCGYLLYMYLFICICMCSSRNKLRR
jgi:hypothetical protein